MADGTAFDLSALQAAAAEGTAGLRRYREQQTALAGSTQSATDQLLAGIQARSGTGASGQAYTQQALAGALGRGSTALDAAGTVAGLRQSVAGGAEPYLNTLHSAEDARAADLAAKIKEASDTTLGRSQTLFDSNQAGRAQADDAQLASQRAALDQLIANQGKAFTEAQQFATQKAATAQAQKDAEDRAKYGGYSSAAEQANAAKGLGAMIQQRAQSALGEQQQAAQSDQNQADMAMAAQAWLQGQKAKTSPVGDTAYGAIHGMGNQLGPQQSPLGLLTGLKAGLAQAMDAYQAQQGHAPDVAPAPGSSVFQQQTSGQQPSTAGLEDALRKLFTGAAQTGAGIFEKGGQEAAQGDAVRQYAGRTQANQDQMAALDALLNTPLSAYQGAGGVDAGLPPEVALGMFPAPTAADQVSQLRAQRDLSSLNQTGQTYEEQQAAALRAATQAPKDAATELDSTISDATGGWDPVDLKNLSGLSETTIAKLVTAPDWAGQPNSTEPGIQDLVNLAIQKVLANDADGQTALEQLLSASDLTTQQKRLIRAQVQSATGINPTTKASGTAPTA
jgi:hypothetical protein